MTGARGRIADAIMRLVLGDPWRYTSSDVADRLAGIVTSTSKKPPRRVITNAVYNLKQAKRLAERDGKLGPGDGSQ